MTFRFCEAVIIVGETVIPTSGSTSSAASGSTARATSSTCSASSGGAPVTASNSAATSGSSRGSGENSPNRSIRAAALTSALSAIPGIDAWPLRPRTRRWNGELIFSATESR